MSIITTHHSEYNNKYFYTMSKSSVRGKESSFYTFSKAKRFKPLRKVHTPDFIDVPSTLSERSCSFGKGKRCSIINESSKDIPSPGSYETPSSFGGKNKGPSFKRKPKISLKKNIVPGPGSYTPFSPIGKNAPKFSFRQKFVISTRSNTPPPGTYKPSFVRIEKNICQDIVFGKSQRSEIYGKLENIPGPGSYEVRGKLGSLSISKKTSSKVLIKKPKKTINK